MTARLPDFLIIGAPRAGTTALARYLDAHPGVFMSRRKELQFFDNQFEKAGLDWYKAQFEPAAPGQLAGEASPHYLYTPEAAQRMAAVIPDARLVAILRHPVDRAWSHYWLRRLWRAEVRTFEQAVDDDLAGRAPRGAEYVGIGRYAEQLERLSHYYESAAVLVLLIDDLAKDARGTFERVCRHIGADASIVPDIVGQRINALADVRSLRLRTSLGRFRAKGSRLGPLVRLIDRFNTKPFTAPELDPRLRSRLLDLFVEPNRELADLLGRDLSAWSR